MASVPFASLRILVEAKQLACVEYLQGLRVVFEGLGCVLVLAYHHGFREVAYFHTEAV
jgi:hypothetical protein